MIKSEYWFLAAGDSFVYDSWDCTSTKVTSVDDLIWCDYSETKEAVEKVREDLIKRGGDYWIDYKPTLVELTAAVRRDA